ncbi:MAG TPA: class I SAM-dependent methyltransferase [Myxococcales bacterium]
MPRRYSRIRDLIHCTSHFGAVLALLRLVLCKARLHALYRRLEQACARYSDRRARAFDLEHGTDTFARIHLRDLGLGAGDESLGEWQYGPINPDFFHEMMRAAPPHRDRLTFLDVGSGKGLALMLASQYRFRRLVGVELSAELNERAARNLARYGEKVGREVRAELLRADFLELPLPEEPTFYFFNNPFPESVGRRAAERTLKAAEQRETWILWRRCTLPIIDLLEASPRLDLAVATPYWRLYRSRAA